MASKRKMGSITVLALSMFCLCASVNLLFTSNAIVVDDGTLADWALVTVSYTDALGDSPIDMTDLVFVAFDFDDTWLYVRWDIDNDGTKPAVLYDMGINITATGTTWDLYVAAQIERISGTPVLTNISIRDAADAHLWNASDDGNMSQDGSLYFDPPPGGTPGTISVEARFPLSLITTKTGLIFSQFRSHSSIQVTSNVKDFVPDAGYIVLSLDDDPPWFSNLTDFPDPQSAGGAVNITVDVMDDYNVNSVWVNITFPDTSTQNLSMSKGAGNRWFLNTTYPVSGMYSYRVWANDSSNNFNSTGPGTFTITGDVTPPVISNPLASPTPQSPGGYVNITVDVTDLAGVGAVWVNVSYPNGTWTNITMTKGTGDSWYYNTSYSDLGGYSFTVWANDVNNNWNSTGLGSFSISDDKGPQFANTNDIPDPQDIGGNVNITVDVTDDVAVFLVWVNVTYPDASFINVSMTKGAADEWFYDSVYNDLGIYLYTIWANDTSGNWNFTAPGMFTIQDRKAPVLANRTAAPTPQENGGFVNITVDAYDDIGLSGVWVNITYPDGLSTNVSMNPGPGGMWFTNTTYADCGDYSYVVWAKDTSDNWNFTAPGTFMIQDTDGPLLSNLDDSPDPQEVGDFVNITVDATDDVGVYGVWVNITFPDASWQNLSMSPGAGGSWFLNSSYTDLGTYSYTIWVNDTSDNWALAGPGMFEIQDTQAPLISDISDAPDPQMIGGSVNISANVTDNFGLGGVWVNITYPNGSNSNLSMTPGAGDVWFFNATFSGLGFYSYTIWAMDMSSNWNSDGPGTFEIKGDIIAPELFNLLDEPDPQSPGNSVNISVDVDDDIAVSQAYVNITYPNGSWVNTTMVKGTGLGWFYNLTCTDMGIYSYTVWAADTSSNWNSSGPGSFRITGDSIPPEISDLAATPNPQGIGGAVNITVNVSDDNWVKSVRVNITYPNGSAINMSMTKGAGDEWFLEEFYFDLGLHSLVIWASDSSDNWNTSGVATFTIMDLDGPEFSDIVDSPDPQLAGSAVNITVNVVDDVAVNAVIINITFPNGSSINATMNPEALSQWFYEGNYSDLGVYTYIIWANDTQGNWNSSDPGIFVIKTDITPPMLLNASDYPDPQLPGGYVNITVQAFDSTALDVVLLNITYPDGSQVNLSMTQGSGNWWFGNFTYLISGLYTYFIWANDTSDNRNATAPGTFLIQDLQAPELDNLVDSPDPQMVFGQVNISLDVTDDVTVSGVWVNITMPDGSWTNVSMKKGMGDNWYYSVSCSELGVYTYSVWAKDASDNWNVTVPASFTVLDMEKPRIVAYGDTPDPQENGGFVNITSTITDNVGVDSVWVNVTCPDGNWLNVSMVAASSSWYYVSPYSDLGIHSYSIWVRDTSGNWNFSAPGTFMIQDTNGPMLTNLAATPAIQLKDGIVNITVDVVDDIAVGFVQVNITYPDGSRKVIEMLKGPAGAWYLLLNYSDPGVYSFTVYANDTSDNRQSMGPGTFDIVFYDLPPIIWGLSHSPSNPGYSDTVTVHVFVRDDFMVAGVWLNITLPDDTQIVYNGSGFMNISMNMGSGYEWTYQDQYMILGEYTYKVFAVDSHGNYNSSLPGTFSVLDNTPPWFENHLETPDPQENGGQVELQVLVFDDVAVADVRLNIRFPDGSSYNLSMNSLGSSRWNFTQLYHDLGLYIYTVLASDTSGNWNASSPQSFLIIDTQGPQVEWPKEMPTPQKDRFNITVNVTDDIKIGGVWIAITYPDGKVINVSMININTNQWYYPVQIEDPGNYTYTIWSVDTSGNWNGSFSGSFTYVPTMTPPKIPKSVYMAVLFIYWPALLILMILALVKRYISQNRFESNLNYISRKATDGGANAFDTLEMDPKDISTLIMLCHTLGIPPEEFILSRFSLENSLQIEEAKGVIDPEKLNVILDSRNIGKKPPYGR